MKYKKFFSVLSSVVVASIFVACASKETAVHQAKVEAAQSPAVLDTSRATAMSGGSDYTVIEFKKGRDELTDSSRMALKNLSAESITRDRAIDEIKVLAWADREYPIDKTKATKKELALADRRAEAIKRYLKTDLRMSADVDNHNMAKRPGMFSELIRSEDYKVKTNFEETGAAPSTVVGNEKRLMGSKVSKAVVFVKYK